MRYNAPEQARIPNRDVNPSKEIRPLLAILLLVAGSSIANGQSMDQAFDA